MIFAPDAVELIRQRRKTQTRRVWKDCRVRVGRCYSVQPGRGRKGLFKVTVLNVRQELLGEISPQDARREGFRFVKEFEDAWRGLHGSFDPELVVWVVSFAVGDLRDRFDTPRLLARTPGHVQFEAESRPVNGDRRRWPGGRWRVAEDGEEHQDYAEHRGMFREPEALTEQQLKPLVEAARRRDDVRRRAEAAELPRGVRLAVIERAAASGDQQAKRHLHVIDQRIQAAERKRTRDAA